MKKISLDNLMHQLYPGHTPHDEVEQEQTISNQGEPTIENNDGDEKQVTPNNSKHNTIEGTNTIKSDHIDLQKDIDNTKKQLEIRLSYGEDGIYYPNHPENLTEIGRQLYELGSFARIRQHTNLNIEHSIQHNKFKIDKYILSPKPGYKLYQVDKLKLFPAQLAKSGRYAQYYHTDKINTIFGLEDENEKIPEIVCIGEHELIDDVIMNGLQPINQFETSHSSFTYDIREDSPYLYRTYLIESIIPQPHTKDIIQQAIDSYDPREIITSFGTVDNTSQKDRSSEGPGYYGDRGDQIFKHMCKDFELLGIHSYSNDTIFDKLQAGTYELTSDGTTCYDKMDRQIKETKKLGVLQACKTMITQLEHDMPLFTSDINRTIAQNKLNRYKKLLPFVQQQEDKIQKDYDMLQLIKSGQGHELFGGASQDNPIVLNNNMYSLEALYHFLQGKLVGYTYGFGSKINTYGTMGEYEYHNNISGLGRLYESSVNIIPQTHISFSGDYEYADIVMKALENVGIGHTYVGQSGFKSRNKYVVQLPTTTIKVHISKDEGEFIHYFGEQEIEVVDETIATKAQEIISQIQQEQAQIKHQKFFDTFIQNSTDGGVSAVIEVGGGPESLGSYDYENFPQLKCIAEKRMHNTADHRRNWTHIYGQVIIDTSKIKTGQTLYLKVPDEYKGLIIGKGGVNIKKLQQELQVKQIILK